MTLKPLLNRVAIVTGAASGIGKATAILLAERGASVVIADKNQQRGTDLATSLSTNGCHALFCYTDIGDANDIQAMVRATVQQYDRIDILVNNAGIMQYSDVDTLALDDWNQLLNINLTSMFLTTQACSGRVSTPLLLICPQLMPRRLSVNWAHIPRAKRVSSDSPKASQSNLHQ